MASFRVFRRVAAALIAVSAMFTIVPALVQTAGAVAVKVSVSGAGAVRDANGRVDCSASGGPDCQGDYDWLWGVTLTATPDPGWTFRGWDRCDGNRSGNVCSFTIPVFSGDWFVAAAFGNNPPSAPGCGQSSATETSVTLSWSASSDDQGVTGYRVYRNGAQVAAPGGAPWTDSGLQAGTTYSYMVGAVDAAGAESARCGPFSVTTRTAVPPPPGRPGTPSPPPSTVPVGPTPTPVGVPGTVAHRLTVAKSSSGGGTVTSRPAAIDCGSSCTASYADGTTVTLTATPAEGSFFAGWTGACSGTAPTCVVAMSAPASATAVFVEPTVRIASARFDVLWRASRATGSLLVGGTANVDATLNATLSHRGAPALTLPIRVDDGTFSASAPLRSAGLAPGAYTVAVSGAVRGVDIPPAETQVVLAAPATGVVAGAFFTLTPNGAPVQRVPPKATQLWVHLPFVAMPAGSPRLTVQWTKPNGGSATPEPARVPLKRTIVTGIRITRAADAGIWTIVLRANDRIVYQVNIRAG